MKRIGWLMLVLVIGAECGATTPPKHTERSTTRLADTQPTALEREQSDAHLARVWGLETTEYARYQRLMRGPRGAFSVPNISPLEVLGIHAETPGEQRRYAERLVQVLFEDTERVLAFQRAVDAAWQRLYPNAQMIDPSRLAANSGAPSTTALSAKRLVVFVSTRCASCRPVVSALLGLAQEGGPTAGLDIYVIDTDDEASIRQYARTTGLDPTLVTRKRITLNKGRELFAKLGGERQVPQVFVREGYGLVPVPRFGR